MPQFAPPDLSCRNSGQGLDELHRARVLVGRRHRFRVRLQLDQERVADRKARPQDDEGLHDLSALSVGAADHSTGRDGGMHKQDVLDLRRADPVTGRVNHIIGPTVAPNIAPCVRGRAVACDVPDPSGPSPRKTKRRLFPGFLRDILSDNDTVGPKGVNTLDEDRLMRMLRPRRNNRSCLQNQGTGR